MIRDSDNLSPQQALLTALSPVLLSLANLTTLDMSPTTGASTAQVQEELMLCQTWSKYCGLRKVVFPSGDVWIQPPKDPELFDESGGWILVGGGSVASSPYVHTDPGVLRQSLPAQITVLEATTIP